MRCIDCLHLDLHKFPKHSKVGLGWCKAQSPKGITAFSALTADDDCSKFQPAPEASIAKRIAWMKTL